MLHRFLLHVALLLVFWLLNAFAPIAQIDMPGWLFLWAFVVGVLFLELILSTLHKKIPINRQLFHLILFFSILISWRLVQSAWSVDSIITIQETVKTAILGIFVAAAYIGLSYMDGADLERLAAIVITVLLHISFGSYVYLLAYQIGDFTYYGLQEGKKYILLFGGSNTAGATILLLGAWNWVLILSKKRRLRCLGFLNAAIAAVTLFGIGSRTALGGFLLAGVVVLMGLLWRVRREPFAAALLVGLLGGTLLGLVLFTPVIIEADANEQYRTFFQRTEMWQEAWHVLSEGAWLVGTGAGTNGGFVFFSAEGIGIRGGVHNALLQTWLEEGLLGLALYVWLFAWLVGTGLSVRTQTGIALLAVALGIFLRNLGESNGLVWGLLNNFLVFASWYVLVHVLILCRKDLNQEICCKQHNPDGGQPHLAVQSVK